MSGILIGLGDLIRLRDINKAWSLIISSWCCLRFCLHISRYQRYLVHKRCAIIVNLATDDHMELLRTFQIGGVPCASKSCLGASNGRWHTEPIGWVTQTQAPAVFIDEDGISNPVTYMKMKCLSCGTQYSPLNREVQRYLRTPWHCMVQW